jgi:ubiquinone/menaquinone biosynthesis C-methylase UbiE
VPDAIDDAVRSHYASESNLATRRALNDYAVGDERPHAAFARLFDWPDDATVLDVGCGDGVWAAVAARRTPRGGVVGLDYSRGMLDALRARTGDVACVHGDANALPVRDASVDVVVAAWMLYHVDLSRALPEYARVLRRGGRLLAATNSSELLPSLDDVLADAASEVAGRELRAWSGTMTFSLENGLDALHPYFAHVERVVQETPYEVPVAEPLVAYVDSIRAPVLARLGATFDYDAFLVLVRRGIEQRLAAGPIRFVRRLAFFVATP